MLQSAFASLFQGSRPHNIEQLLSGVEQLLPMLDVLPNAAIFIKDIDARYVLADDAPARWATDVADWVRSDADRVWLASVDGALVGLLTAHLYTPAPTFVPSLMVWVDDLFVAPEVRSRGIGRLLLDEARVWAHGVGATEIRAGVLATNPGGRAFWTREGASDVSTVVSIPL